MTASVIVSPSFASASAQVAHFGLPDGVTTVDVVVTWPDGHEQRVPVAPIHPLVQPVGPSIVTVYVSMEAPTLPGDGTTGR